MTTSPPPPPNEQCTIIKEIFARKFNGSRPLKGKTNFLLAALWWNKWTEYVGFNKQEPTSDVSPGEIDNIRLLERNAETDEPEDVVKGTLLENTDYVFVPDEAWTQLQSWYAELHAFMLMIIVALRRQKLSCDLRLHNFCCFT